jgi:hypothetical protein
MFFASEEFLRQYESGQEFEQTIGEVVPVDGDLFEEGSYESKAKKKRTKQDS